MAPVSSSEIGPMYIYYNTSASSTYLLGKGGKPGDPFTLSPRQRSPGTPAGGFPCTPFPNSSGDFALEMLKPA